MTEAPRGDPLIAASGLGLRQGRRVILDAVDLTVGAGEIVTVIGPNGGGKTTLLRVLIGSLVPGAGRVWRRPGLRLGYTPQKMQIERTIPVTVDRFLSLAGPQQPGARGAVLDRVGVEGLRAAQLADLSGGEMQRVLLARALLREPDLLILDEPTQGLDQPAEAAFYRLLGEIRAERGVGVLLVSHDLHVVMGASDRVVCLNGHVCCHGAPEKVSMDPVYREMFGSRAEFALYRHHHDHSHDHIGTGHPVPPQVAGHRGSTGQEEGAAHGHGHEGRHVHVHVHGQDNHNGHESGHNHGHEGGHDHDPGHNHAGGHRHPPPPARIGQDDGGAPGRAAS